MHLALSRFKILCNTILVACLLCNSNITFANAKRNTYAHTSSEYSPGEYATNDQIRGLRDSAAILFENLTKAGAWINDFGENTTTQLPIGVKKKIGGTEYQVAISAIYFGGNTTTARVFARSILPQTDAEGNKKVLYFSGFADITRVGGIVSDGKLALIGNDSVRTTGNWSLALKGNDPLKPGKITEQTYFSFDCAGFKELGVIGDVVLSKDVFMPVSPSYQYFTDPTQVSSAPINVVVNSFSSLLVNKLKFSKPFMLKKTKDYTFQIDEATLDFSDKKNPEGTAEGFAKYLEEVQPDEPNTWQGLIITKMQVFLPREFKVKDSKDRVGFTAPYGVIDATGFSTEINQKNILPLEKGRAGTWAFSVDEIGVYIKYNQLNGGSLGGKLILPIQSKSGKDGLSYFGKITKDGEYEITVGSLKDIKASFWKAKLELDKSSSVTLKVKDGEFLPKVNLSGKISFNMDGSKEEAIDDDASPKKKKKAFSCDGIIFEELELQTVKPYFQVKAMGVEGKLHIASFEAEYSVTVGTDIKQDVTGPKIARNPSNNVNNGATTVNDGTTNTAGTERASLNIKLDVKIMNGKIGGKTALAINAIYNEKDGEWQFDNVVLGMIGISADFGKAKFEGELAILKNDDVYGNAFAGALKLKVNKFELQAKGIFGSKDDFRYWSVDGMAKGFKIQAGPITFTGFSGGVTYKMDVADKESPKLPSGILYVPSNDAFLRVRAGVLFDVMTKELITATAGLEIVFNSNWGVNSMAINGTLRMMAGDDNKGEARMKGSMRKFANPNTSAAPKEDASVWGDVFIKFDFENSVYSGVMNSYVNFADYVVGGMGSYQSGKASFYASDDKWYINVGTDKVPNSIKLNGPIGVTGTGYFMMGNNIPSPYGTGNFALKHGMSASITLSGNIGWLWAEFGGGFKYDILLMKTQNFQCNGSAAGLNGWFGEGRISAGMYGAVGARFHKRMPWFLPDIRITATIFRASINASLFLSGPKPFYASGHLSGSYRVFIFSGSFGINFSKGTKCGAPPPPPYKLNPKDQAVEDDIRARRDIIVKELNELVAQQSFDFSKNYLKKANKSFFDSLQWITPIDLKKNEAFLVQAKNYLSDFRKSKEAETQLISKRDTLLSKFNELLKAAKGKIVKDTLKAHILFLTQEKSWATPIDQPKANAILQQQGLYLDQFKKAKEAEQFEDQTRLQKVEKAKEKQKEIELAIQDFRKKIDREKKPIEKAKLTLQLNALLTGTKNIGLDIRRDELLIDLTKQLENTTEENTANLLIDKINKLKLSTYANLEANLNAIEKQIAAEKEAKRKEEERIAAEKKLLSELQLRKSKALAEAPSKVNRMIIALRGLGNQALDKLKSAQTAGEIAVGLGLLNAVLKTKY